MSDVIDLKTGARRGSEKAKITQLEEQNEEHVMTITRMQVTLQEMAAEIVRLQNDLIDAKVMIRELVD